MAVSAGRSTATRGRGHPAGAPARRDARIDSLRRAAECALLGAVWFAFSLPLVTAGAAWSAVADVCAAWARGEEPSLLRTFAARVRRDLAGGLVLQLAAAALVVVPYLEIRIALAGHLPGARVESAALGLVGCWLLVVVLLAFPARATGLAWPAAVRDAARVVRTRPWVVPTAAAALMAAALLVYAVPPLAAVMAGPLGYALSATYLRATAHSRSSG